MEHWIILIFCGVIVGISSIAIFATLMMLWEKMSPYSKNPTEDEDRAFNHCFRRMSLCLGLACGLLYVTLTYWWR